MTDDILLWIVGVSVVPVLGWCIYMTAAIQGLRRDSHASRQDEMELVRMLRNPDQYGFGSGDMNDAVTQLANAVKALTHYVSWLCKHTTGEDPPPPLK